MDIAKDMGYRECLAINHYVLGQVYAQNNKEKAIEHWQQSLELFKYISSPNEKVVQGRLDNLK